MLRDAADEHGPATSLGPFALPPEAGGTVARGSPASTCRTRRVAGESDRRRHAAPPSECASFARLHRGEQAKAASRRERASSRRASTPLPANGLPHTLSPSLIR